MLRTLRLGVTIALFFCYPIAHAESTTSKCTDGKTITYANIPCEELGLVSAGPVKKAVTIVPATPVSQISPQKNPPGKPAENSGKKGGEKDKDKGNEPVADGEGAEKIKPINPLLEKLMH